MSGASAEFIELSDENFGSTLENHELAIVDYFAAWCGACRLAAPMFLRVAGAANLPIFKIDAEKNPESRTGVEIQSLPTIALFRKGQPVASICTTKEEGLKDFLLENGVKF
jgi:thioredoxin 1